MKRFKLTATIKILFVSKTFSLLDISETDEYKKLTEDLELEVNISELFTPVEICVCRSSQILFLKSLKI